MQDFILEYADLESISKYSKSLGKQAEEYAESLGSGVKDAIGNVTGGSSGYLTSASDSVSDKIIALKQKSDAFYHFTEQISDLLEVAERMDQEVADAIIAQREYFLEHHESLRIENWKTKLLDLLVDMKISTSLLTLIADILNGLDTVLKSSKATIKDWYKGEGKKTAEAGKDVKPDWEFIYGRTNLWPPPDLKNIGENGKVDLKSTIKQEYNTTTNNNVTEANAYDWDWTFDIGTDDWMNKPAKKDPFDKLDDFLGEKLFGIKPREKTQADQLFSSFYMGLQFDQQQVASEFSEGLADTMKSAASYDAMIESELPVNSIPVMPNNKINSIKGVPKVDSLTGDEGLGAGIKGGEGVLENANYAQKTYSNTFSADGRKIYSKLVGEPINTINDLVNAINAGKINVDDLPVEYIVRDGNTLILNTRTSQALAQAGIPRNQWNAVNRTGNELFEELLTGQLSRNKLPAEGIPTVRPSGGN